jgi:hypothetical protein
MLLVKQKTSTYLISIITKTVAIYLYCYDINVNDVNFKKSPRIINIMFFCVVAYNRISQSEETRLSLVYSNLSSTL